MLPAVKTGRTVRLNVWDFEQPVLLIFWVKVKLNVPV